MTVEDTLGNSDTCVMEIYVKGMFMFLQKALEPKLLAHLEILVRIKAYYKVKKLLLFFPFLGCGCTNRTCDYKQRNGISTCTITDDIPDTIPDTIPLTHIISCNLQCPANLTSNNLHFHGQNMKCLPGMGWEREIQSGCVGLFSSFS